MVVRISRLKRGIALVCEYGGIVVMLTIAFRVFLLAICTARTSVYHADENIRSLTAENPLLRPFGGYLCAFALLFVIGLGLWRYGTSVRASIGASHRQTGSNPNEAGPRPMLGVFLLGLALLLIFCLAVTATSPGDLEEVSQELGARADDANSLASDNESRINDLESRVDDVEWRLEEVEGARWW